MDDALNLVITFNSGSILCSDDNMFIFAVVDGKYFLYSVD